jgi:hypothetical protein
MELTQMISISMLQRDEFGRRTDNRVEHTSRDGHSINAFFARGGRYHSEFEALPATACARILKSMADEKAVTE